MFSRLRPGQRDGRSIEPPTRGPPCPREFPLEGQRPTSSSASGPTGGNRDNEELDKSGKAGRQGGAAVAQRRQHAQDPDGADFEAQQRDQGGQRPSCGPRWWPVKSPPI